jgi:hypothetical protein
MTARWFQTRNRFTRLIRFRATARVVSTLGKRKTCRNEVMRQPQKVRAKADEAEDREGGMGGKTRKWRLKASNRGWLAWGIVDSSIGLQKLCKITPYIYITNIISSFHITNIDINRHYFHTHITITSFIIIFFHFLHYHYITIISRHMSLTYITSHITFMPCYIFINITTLLRHSLRYTLPHYAHCFHINSHYAIH